MLGAAPLPTSGWRPETYLSARAATWAWSAEAVMKKSPYEEALALVEAGGAAEAAYQLLTKASEQGDHRADYAIGTWYLHGFFLKKNVKKGTQLIKKAADNDVADAAFDMAVSYEKGVGVKKNPGIAAAYYLRALRCGDASAAKELERMFYWGIGVVKNRRLANEFALFEPNRIVN